MDHFTITVSKIANGYTVSRALYADSRYVHSDAWFFADLDGAQVMVAAFVESAEDDAANMPADAQHAF